MMRRDGTASTTNSRSATGFIGSQHVDEVTAAIQRLDAGQGRTLDEIIDGDASQA
jgi:hypothetical protein